MNHFNSSWQNCSVTSKISLCLIALLFTAPMLAMEKGKKRAAANSAASSEKKNPNADILAVLQATMLHLETASLMMHSTNNSLITRMKIINAAKANPSEQPATASAPANAANVNPSEQAPASAPAAQTASASTAQPQQPAPRTMTVEEMLKRLDAHDEAMQKIVSLTGDLARTSIDDALKKMQGNQDDDDSDDLDDNQGESSINNNNNNNK